MLSVPCHKHNLGVNDERDTHFGGAYVYNHYDSKLYRCRRRAPPACRLRYQTGVLKVSSRCQRIFAFLASSGNPGEMKDEVQVAVTAGGGRVTALTAAGHALHVLGRVHVRATFC